MASIRRLGGPDDVDHRLRRLTDAGGHAIVAGEASKVGVRHLVQFAVEPFLRELETFTRVQFLEGNVTVRMNYTLLVLVREQHEIPGTFRTSRVQNSDRGGALSRLDDMRPHVLSLRGLFFAVHGHQNQATGCGV